jgi:S1-C subfamily serine protease
MKRSTIILYSCLISLTISLFVHSVPWAQLHETGIKKYASQAIVKLYAVTEEGKVAWGGTGFITKTATGASVIVTNSHVCGDRKDISLVRYRGIKLRQRAIDFIADLCVLDYAEKVEQFLYLAQEEEPEKETVYVLGHPGLRELTLTSGLKFKTADDLIPIGNREQIEETHKEIKCYDAGQGANILEIIYTQMYCYITRTSYRISAEIEPGSSGSPVLNWRGQVIGVVWGMSEDENKGLAVPLKQLKTILEY